MSGEGNTRKLQKRSSSKSKFGLPGSFMGGSKKEKDKDKDKGYKGSGKGRRRSSANEQCSVM